MRARTLIRLALRERLLSVASLPAVRQLVGQRFTRPAASTPYVRESFLPGPTRVDGLPAATGTEIVDGVLLVDLFVPETEDGLVLGEAIAADVATAFRVGVPNGTIPTGDPAVGLQTLGASSARELPDGAGRLQIPVTVRWRSQTPNDFTA